MPDTLVELEVIKRAVRLACRAPSLHNSQPWRWAVDGNAVHLYLDRNRILHATDRAGREAIISCGAVLDHFRVAMAAAGWTANIDRFPGTNEPDHLASIDFAPTDSVTDADRQRAQAIPLRRTDRLPFAPPTEWASFEPQLHNAVHSDAVRLDVLSDDARGDLKEASMLTESLRLYDSSYHTELGWWTAPYEASEGIPYGSLVSEDERERVDVGRTFPAPRHQERRPDVPTDYSKIVVLSTYGDSHEDALRCGEVLSSVLLECTVAGLATCTLTHITELAASRHIIALLIEQDSTPQVVVRVGVAPSTADMPPATPRRPLEDVLRVRR
jgi:nitroreductase